LLSHFLQGDYYSYSNLNGSVEDVSLLNIDRPFKLIYKDFMTGPGLAEDTTSGAFGVDHATGAGHVSVEVDFSGCSCLMVLVLGLREPSGLKMHLKSFAKTL
jgi:hypothetical protein